MASALNSALTSASISLRKDFHFGRHLQNDFSTKIQKSANMLICSVAKDFESVESNETFKNEKKVFENPTEFDFSSSFQKRPKNARNNKKYQAKEKLDSKATEVANLLNDNSNGLMDLSEILNSAALNTRDMITVIKESNWNTAIAIFQWMKNKENYEPKVIIYNVLIKTLARQRQWKLADDLAKELIQIGLEPDNFTYSSLINSSSRCGYHDDAIKWFEHMQNSNCIPDEITYCAAISAMSSAGKLQRGLQLYEQMVEAGWRISDITYSSVVNMYGKAGLYDDAHKLFLQCKADGIKPNRVFYNTMVHIYCSAEKTDLAFKCVDEMKEAGVGLDSKTYTSLIFLLGRKKNDLIHNVVKEMEDSGIKFDILAFNALLFAYRNSQRYDDAETVFIKMKGLGLRLTDITLKEMLRVYAEKGDVKKAYEMKHEMVERGLGLDLTVFTNLIIGFGKAGLYEEVKNVYDSMDGFKPDHFVLSGLFMNLSTCRNFEEASPILYCIQQSTPCLYHFMIESVQSLDENDSEIESQSTAGKDSDAFKSRCLSEIDDLFKYVPSDSLNPLINPILNSLYHLGLYHRAEIVYSIARKYGAFKSTLIFNNKVWQFQISGLSVGSSFVALRHWLVSMKERINLKKEMNEDKVTVEVLMGTDSPLKECKASSLVVAELDKMEIQFDLVGPKLVFSEPELKAWLFSDEFDEKILLKDEPIAWLIDVEEMAVV